MQALVCRNGEKDGQKNSLKLRQYKKFFAYLIVKAGFWYCLLNDNQAERDRKEVLMK
jgi:hypothetical protein